jgi:hypothetical protein
MQIGLLNHLNFSKGSHPLLAGNAEDSTPAAVDGSATSGLEAPALAPLKPSNEAPGVVLKLQGEAASAIVAKGLVYSDGRKLATRGDARTDANSDIDRMAEQHSQAWLRNAGSTTQLTVDKDGILVAGAAPAADTKPRDFVTFAVTAMRDYADEQDRLKSATQASATPASDSQISATHIIPRSMAEVQRLAARFKLFA